MLTKDQYKFLKALLKASKQYKKDNTVAKFQNRECVDSKGLEALLIKYPKINAGNPYKISENDSLNLPFLIQYIEIYLKQAGLEDCVDYFAPDKYSVSNTGKSKIEEYKNHLIKKWSSILTLVLSIIAIIISIIALAIKA